jgi:hypothetical protein
VATTGPANLRLAADATQFIITEEKIFSALSPGVKNARFVDQAARNLTCMAEVSPRAATRQAPPVAIRSDRLRRRGSTIMEAVQEVENFGVGVLDHRWREIDSERLWIHY